jgi:hypothetical protein
MFQKYFIELLNLFIFYIQKLYLTWPIVWVIRLNNGYKTWLALRYMMKYFMSKATTKDEERALQWTPTLPIL